MLLLAVAVPMALKALITSPWVESAVATLRWALLWVFAVLSLTVTCRFAPARKLARWRWVSLGSVVAATLWVTGSLLFALCLRIFGSYANMYGALGGVVVLLMWFYLSSFFVVLGAEINAEMERQTKQATIEGAEVPIGQRDTHAADSVGPCAAVMTQAKRSL
jgi:membrane protein